MSLKGYLYTLQVICTAQVTCLVHIYEPNSYLHILQVICTVQITCLVHEPIAYVHEYLYTLQFICTYISIQYQYTFVVTGYLYIFYYSTNNLFSTHL